MATATVARPIHPARSAPATAQPEVIPDARELHRVITASVRELLETARLEAQAGPMDVAESSARPPPSSTACPH